jgi:hypothetical protein
MTDAFRTNSMSRPRFVPDCELEEQELEHADTAHELPDRRQAAGRPA